MEARSSRSSCPPAAPVVAAAAVAAAAPAAIALPDSVAELQRMVLSQKKTIQVLTKQIAKKQSEGGSALDHLRQNRMLEEVVQRKTHELDVEREKLQGR